MTAVLFQPLLACATCMGAASDHATRAAGVSILFLLVVVLFIGGACIRFFLFLAKCERQAAQPAAALGRDDSVASPLATRE